MHAGAKWTMIVGAILLVISGLVFGGTSFSLMSDVMGDPETTWEGEAPDNVTMDLRYETIIPVFVESGSNVTVVTGEGNAFIPCEEDGTCGMYHRSGMVYIGTISPNINGEHTIHFEGEGAVEVAEIPIDVGAALGSFFGMIGICCGGTVLVIGIIMALVMKGPPRQGAQMVVIDPMTGEMQPAAGHHQPPLQY